MHKLFAGIFFLLFLSTTVFSAERIEEQNTQKVLLNYYAHPGPEYGNLALQSLHFLWLMPAGIASIILMPSNFTLWYTTLDPPGGLGQSWLSNIKGGPVFDHDGFVFNYIIHPYLGGAIYVMAANHGLPWWQSFLYVSLISAFWEFGPEAFFEPPSINDLIVTPVLGSLVGVGFYLIETQIIRGGRKILGSRFLGGFCLFLINPIGSLLDFIQRRKPSDEYQVSGGVNPVFTWKETGLYWHVKGAF